VDPFEQDVESVLSLLDGSLPDASGEPLQAALPKDTDNDVWVHGTTAGLSAGIAGSLGLPFGSNYHVTPSFVPDAIGAYREALRPSARLATPYITVSVDVVVADSDSEAHRIGRGYAERLVQIRKGVGSGPELGPSAVAENGLSDDDRGIARARLLTRFVGTLDAVADRLESLVAVTGANDLLLTTSAFEQPPDT
jgi:alkanesulfonate monooxygenase SsuD/methylene tetrahydromethanopterin reductase-like flavin-dependent oxidoreductase (luciferase family)